MVEKKISVIVPVYNTGKYLRRCVDSIVNQTYKNLEIILVDDGSTDDSHAICDEYAKKDNRIKVIHKTNGGLSSARNAGLDSATGDYIAFVDSDDFVNKRSYEILISVLERDDSDISIMRFLSFNQEDEIQKFTDVTEYDCKEIKGVDYLKNIFTRVVSESVCDKVFSKSIIGALRFDETKLNEDFLFLSQILLKNPQITYCDFCGYYYFKRAGSISRSGYNKAMEDAVYNADYIVGLVEASFPALLSVAKAYSVYQARTAIIVMTKSQFKEEIAMVSYCREIIKRNKKYIRHSFLKFKDKLFCYLFAASPRFAKLISAAKR